MKYIKKTKSSDPIIQQFQQHAGVWDNLKNHLKNSVKDILKEEQSYLCAYCEDELPEGENKNGMSLSHIEHIYPRSTYQDKAYHYNNIVMSCGGDRIDGTKIDHCGKHKKNYDPAHGFISPLDPHCAKNFSYSLTGEIKSDPSNRNAWVTINKLNLNDKKLRDKRKEVIKIYTDIDITESDARTLLEKLPKDTAFYSTIIYILKKHMIKAHH